MKLESLLFEDRGLERTFLNSIRTLVNIKTVKPL